LLMVCGRVLLSSATCCSEEIAEPAYHSIVYQAVLKFPYILHLYVNI
jgi:hypothetical protein